MNVDVALACERCCVTNGYLQRLVWDVNGFSEKREKMLCFSIKSTYLIALLYFLLFPRVSGRFVACENIRFSSFFAADVPPRDTSGAPNEDIVQNHLT